MQDQDFQRQFDQLLQRINDLPEPERARLQDLAGETRHRHERMRKTIGDLQESLDYLRVSVKYLVFDLEATRRENKQLRTLLSKDGEIPGADPDTGETHEAD